MKNLGLAGMLISALAAAAIGLAGSASADAGPYVPGLHHHHHTWVVTATAPTGRANGNGSLGSNTAGSSGVTHQ